MTNIVVFSQKDADKMVELGYTFSEKKTDINGKEIWYYFIPSNLTFSESNNLPSSAIILDRVCMSF